MQGRIKIIETINTLWEGQRSPILVSKICSIQDFARIQFIISVQDLQHTWLGLFSLAHEDGIPSSFLQRGDWLFLYPPQTKFGGYVRITLRPFTSCPGHNFLPTFPIWIIFYTIVFHDPRVCHDFDPSSYFQGQGHSAHITKIRVLAIIPHCQVGSGYNFTQLLSMTQGCVMTLGPRSRS